VDFRGVDIFFWFGIAQPELIKPGRKWT